MKQSETVRYGMPTLLENESIDDCAELCSRLGLDFIELSMDLPAYQSMFIDTDHFSQLSEKYGIGYTIHLNAYLNISDFNPYLAEASMRTVMESIEIGRKLGAPALNMHMARGDYFTLPDKRVNLYDVYRDFYLDSMRKFRSACEDTIRDAPMKICIENCNGYTDFQKEALAILLESPVFGLTLDIGHCAAADFVDEPYIYEHIDKLTHMHIHDALGKKNHLPLGEGELDIGKYLALAQKQNCTVVLETKTIAGLRKSVDWLNNR